MKCSTLPEEVSSRDSSPPLLFPLGHGLPHCCNRVRWPTNMEFRDLFGYVGVQISCGLLPIQRLINNVMIVCVWRNRANSPLRHPCDRTQEASPECAYLPGSHSSAIRKHNTHGFYLLWIVHEHPGDGHASHWRLCCYFVSHWHARGSSHLPYAVECCSLHHVGRVSSDILYSQGASTDKYQN